MSGGLRPTLVDSIVSCRLLRRRPGRSVAVAVIVERLRLVCSAQGMFLHILHQRFVEYSVVDGRLINRYACWWYLMSIWWQIGCSNLLLSGLEMWRRHWNWRWWLLYRKRLVCKCLSCDLVWGVNFRFLKPMFYYFQHCCVLYRFTCKKKKLPAPNISVIGLGGCWDWDGG